MGNEEQGNRLTRIEQTRIMHPTVVRHCEKRRGVAAQKDERRGVISPVFAAPRKESGYYIESCVLSFLATVTNASSMTPSRCNITWPVIRLPLSSFLPPSEKKHTQTHTHTGCVGAAVLRPPPTKLSPLGRPAVCTVTLRNYSSST